MIKIIDKYILREIFFSFLITIFILTFVLLMGRIIQLMDLMINKGISLLDISRLILYLLPSFFQITIPISLLISILVGLGRFSADNEIVILKSAGISLCRISLPIAGVSIFAFVITAIMGFYFVPYGNYATRNLLFDIAKQKASIGIKEKVFNDDFKGLVLYADNIPVNGNYMEGVFVSDNRIGKVSATIIARRGYLISNPESMTVTLRLKDGSTHNVDPNYKTYKKMDFSSYDINLDLSTSISTGNKKLTKKSQEMKVHELIAKIQSSSHDNAEMRDFIIELNRKLTIPLSCIVFGLLGIPLGIGQARSGKSRGFTVGLFVIMIYYLLRLSGEGLGETGKLSPLIGVWASNVILGTAGIYLFIRASKERLPKIDFIFRPINRWKSRLIKWWRNRRTGK
jgi:lipopolysaccharide export system permease protein